MKLRLVILALGGSMLLLACGRSHVYDASVKQLDSLKVVVEQALDGYIKTDSASCRQVLNKQASYAAFMMSHVNDTIPANEAQTLREFYATGTPLRHFFSTRALLISDARTSVQQLKNLSHDLTSGAVESEKAIGFINDEKIAAEKIISQLKQSTEQIHIQLETFNRTLPVVENMARRYNQGALPPVTPAEL
ncbi:MAG: hypothetical protein JST26_15560 [Bacteroidetes bacterium]|nr:hypothetical protein [Bacteroidota bacterium]